MPIEQELYLVLKDGEAIVAYPRLESTEVHTKYFHENYKVAVIKGMFHETEVVKDVDKEGYNDTIRNST